MANFFIRRPIVAIVISILIVLLGPHSLQRPQHRAVPVPRPAHDPRHRQLPRRLRGGGRAVGGDADRAGGQRRREHDLHEVVEHQRRPHAARRQLRGRHGPGHGQRPDPEPRLSAQARLPQEVIQQGVTVKKQSPSILMLISLYSPKGTLRRQLPDQLLRHQPARPAPAHPRHRPGRPLRRHRLRHADLARPDKLAKLGLTPSDVIAAIKEQNLQAPGGPRRRRARRRRTRSSPTRSAPRAAWSPPRSSRTSSSARRETGAPDPDQGRRAASSSARRTTTPSGA